MSGDGAPTRSDAGRFAWHDLMTTDLERARAFYTELFDLRTEAVDLGDEGTYTMLVREGRAFGGILPLAADQGIPSHWLGYATVDDLDTALERTRVTGGTVALSGRELPDTGRFSVVVDPEGAALALFEPFGDGPAEPPGVMVWNQLLTRRPVAVQPFYRDVLGWSMRRHEAEGIGEFWLFYRGEDEIAGVLQMPEGSPAGAFWLPYVGVDDVDAAAVWAEELGATTHVQPVDLPDVGRYAVLADPTGATIALFKPVTPEA